MSEAKELSGKLLKMLEGDVSEGGVLASKRELAKKFGLSPATVSNAIRLLKDEGKVRSVPGKGVFLAGVEGLRRQSKSPADKPRVVGLAGSYLPSGESLDSDGIDSIRRDPMLDGIWSAAQKSGAVLAMLSESGHEIEMPLIRKLKLDGIIIAGGMGQAELMKLRRCGIPAILTNYPAMLAPPLNFIDYDAPWMLEEAIRLFKEKGRRRPAFLCMSEFSVPGFRRWLEERWQLALIRAGLFYEYPRYMALEHAAGSSPQGCAEAAAMLSLDEPPDAFLCWGPDAVDGVRKAVADQGLQVPRDVSIVASWMPPASDSCSCFAQSRTELGRLVFEGLLKAMSDPQIQIAEFIKPVYREHGTL